MIKRSLEKAVFSPDFGRQMRFICGPRQTGKTTLAKSFLARKKCSSLYYNWDTRQVRNSFRENSRFFEQPLFDAKARQKWLCMDEIHKYPKWKDVLKDFYDSFEARARFIVTGSARLDMFHNSGDSLTGRFFLFHLYPIVLSELTGKPPLLSPPDNAIQLLEASLANPKYHEEAISTLLKYSGFPEPLTRGNTRFSNKWRQDYIDSLVMDDLRDLTAVKELENIMTLISLLPYRIGAPLSINSLSGDISASHATLTRYMKALEFGYVLFSISPYSKSISRSIRKEKKVYFFDWVKAADEGRQFENYVAVELKSLISLWNDYAVGDFSLGFIRDRDGHETDFVILKDHAPWLLIECKLSRGKIDYHHKKIRLNFGSNIPFVQLVRQDKVAENPESGIYQLSASRFFG